MNFDELVNYFLNNNFILEQRNNTHLNGSGDTYNFMKTEGGVKLFGARKYDSGCSFCIYRDSKNELLRLENKEIVLNRMGLSEYCKDFILTNNGRDLKISIKPDEMKYFSGKVVAHFNEEKSTLPPESFVINSNKGGDVFKNVIKYGPPGTGKTYSLLKNVEKILGLNKEFNNLQSLSRSSELNVRIEFVTFHQSFSYEEFVEGIRAEVNDSGQVGYFIRNGIFKRICRRAYFYKVKEIIRNIDKNKEYSKEDFCGLEKLFSQDALQAYENISAKQFAKNFSDLYQLLEDYQIGEHGETVEIPKFVLCIDEINRANISRVLGELITLIEDNKRQGARDAISLTLPYSGEEFFVPDNLFIIGTMNTSDRSLAKLDIALRRRFYFEECYPNLELLNDGTIAHSVLKNLNNFLEKELDREHTIGHSYLMGLDNDEYKIGTAFKMKIKPLLQEYFLHQPSKVQEALNATGLSVTVLKNL